MKVSAEVEIACSLASREAQRRRHDLMTVEHLLYALLYDEETARVLSKSGGNVERIRHKLERWFDEQMPKVPEGRTVIPTPSRGFQRILQRAAIHVESSGRDELRGHHVLVAIFGEADSPAVQLLAEEGVARYDVVSYVAHGVARNEDEDELAGEASSGADTDERLDGQVERDPLSRFAVNLNQRAARGELDPLVGREKELRRAIQILARRRKNNPLFVGDAGVGKTALVEGLAALISRGEVPPLLREAVIYSLDMGALLAGTRFRGDFENRLKSVLRALGDLPAPILFVDEIHNVVGAGATTGGTLDAANLLKPALTTGRMRCIGATTFEDYRTHFERDRALARRFQKIEVLEPSLEDTLAILQGLMPQYQEFHGVTYEPAAIEAAAKLAERHLFDRRLPDKAIDLVDEAGADAKLELGAGAIVDADRIGQVLARMAQVPPRQVSADDKTALRNLETELQHVVFGQDRAIRELTSAIKLSRAGLRPPEKPIGSYLFTGPTGVGKTEVARQLARVLGVELIRFDMSEYQERHTVSRLIGAPPGYVGYDRGGLLTEAISKTPHAVLLLDEVEKAHPDVFNVLLQVMDHGTLTDNNGKKSDFRHVVLIMTSNVGAAELARAPLGFGRRTTSGNEDAALRSTFSPEFRNRLDARIAFDALTPEVMLSVVDKFIRQLSQQLLDRQVTLSLTPAAREYFARAGYSPEFGARPLDRLLQDELKRPLSEELLFGRLERGGQVTVDHRDGTLELSYSAGAPSP
jgi:ATP-dependent Clp protease ATP-binding subunit ClpA